jgi:large subunit ribosomal protein L25
MKKHSINGELRSATGKKSSAALRKENIVPAVIYGGENNIHFHAHKREFKDLVYSADFKVVEVNAGGTSTKCILKDLQMHPVTDELVHLDFQEMVPNKKMILELPIRFKGESPGVKTGGKIQQLIRRIKVKVNPENLVDEIFVDISKLELGMSARVKELEINDGIEVMLPGATPVAIVETPRALKSADAEEGAADATAVEGAEAAAEPAADAAK